MFDQLVIVAVSLVTFILVIGVGLIVSNEFGDSVGGTTNDTIQTLKGYLGTGSGGLGTWVPAIIALVIGVLFIAAIMGLRNIGGKTY